MTGWLLILLAVPGVLGLGAVVVVVAEIRRKNLQRWLGTYLLDLVTRRRRSTDTPIDVLICVADHYEPLAGHVDVERGLTRVRHWVEEYPRLFGEFRDSDGRSPRHTFFFPAEEYEPAFVDPLAALCRAGFGEVEIHLHHHDDTAENLRRTLETFKTTL